MAKRNGWILRPAAMGLLLLAGCQNIPYYDESLNWFSWSDYDPEIETIEAQTSPPGALEEAPAARDDRGAFVGDSSGGYVWTDPPPNVVVALGATPFAARGSAAGTAGNITVADGSGSPPDPGSPLVGIRNSIGPSVTWRSVRGAP
jgi:hypothetical protein